MIQKVHIMTNVFKGMKIYSCIYMYVYSFKYEETDFMTKFSSVEFGRTYSVSEFCP